MAHDLYLHDHDGFVCRMNPISLVLTKTIDTELRSKGIGNRAWTSSYHKEHGLVISRFPICFRGNRAWQTRRTSLEWPVFATTQLKTCASSGMSQVGGIMAFWERGGEGHSVPAVIVDPDPPELEETGGGLLGDGGRLTRSMTVNVNV